jgi:hypothetical protein
MSPIPAIGLADRVPDSDLAYTLILGFDVTETQVL